MHTIYIRILPDITGFLYARSKCYNQDGQLLTSYNTRNSNLSNDIVLDITEWNKAIWLANDGGGVNIIYPDTRDIQILSNKEKPTIPSQLSNMPMP